MKQANTINVLDLHTDSRVFTVAADRWHADVVKGKSIRIHGVDGNRHEPRELDRTFEVGDRAVYDSYNLFYVGTIVSITDKTVTIDKGDSTRKKVRLPLAVFVSRNLDSMEEIDARNARTMMEI